jgi:hypothetical protein
MKKTIRNSKQQKNYSGENLILNCGFLMDGLSGGGALLLFW